MKKGWILILGLLLLSISALNIPKTSAVDVSWNISPKLWYATWNLPFEGWSEKEQDLDASSMMYGLSGSVTVNKFNFGLAFLTGSFDFKAKDTWEVEGYGFPVEYSLNPDRFDTDIYFGYKFFEPYFTLTLGYKLIQYDVKSKADTHSDFTGDIKSSINMDVKENGFGVGFSGAVPIKNGPYLYYMGSILPFMKSKADVESKYSIPDLDYEESEKISSDDDMKLYNVELGVGYMITDKIAISLGWKYQYIDYKDDDDHDNIDGITTMANFNF